jgi:hypothetical protein
MLYILLARAKINKLTRRRAGGFQTYSRTRTVVPFTFLKSLPVSFHISTLSNSNGGQDLLYNALFWYSFPYTNVLYSTYIYISESVDRVLSVTAANFAKGSELLLSRRKATIVNGRVSDPDPYPDPH